MVNTLVCMTHKSTDIIASFAKGLAVLDCFGADTPRLSISDAAEATRLDRAAARRYLLTLHHEGFADYDGKYFSLTPRALGLGSGALESIPLSQHVQPWLDQLSEQIGQSTSVAILDDTDIVYVARAAQRRLMSIGLMPGSRLPAACTSLGRVLLAALDDNDIRQRLTRANLTPRTTLTLTDPDEILSKIADVRRDGFAVIDQEVELGLRSIAVPLENARGQTIGALNVGLPAFHDTLEQLRYAYLPAMTAVQDGMKRVLS